MLTKKEFIDLVIEGLSGGAAPDKRKYHPVVISKFIDTGVNSFVAAQIKQQLLEGKTTVDSAWIKVFNNVPIKYDQIRGQTYIKFPRKVLYMEDNAGVREIGWSFQDGSPTFRIMDASSYQVISNLECSQLESTVFFALIEGDRAYFPGMPQKYAIDKIKLMTKTVCSFSSYNNDEEVPIPEERAAEVIDVVFRLMAGFRATRQKVTNDSNPNTI